MAVNVTPVSLVTILWTTETLLVVSLVYVTTVALFLVQPVTPTLATVRVNRELREHNATIAHLTITTKQHPQKMDSSSPVNHATVI